MKKESLFDLLFIATFIIAFYLFYRILSPFLVTLAWATIITIIFYPLFKLLNKLFRQRRGLAAITMTIIVIIAIIFPSGLMLNLIAKELVDMYNVCEQFVQEGRHLAILEGLKKIDLIQDIWERLDRSFDLSHLDLKTTLLDNLKKVSLYVAGQASQFIKEISVAIFHFFIMSVALFFLFRDGERLMDTIKTLIPFSPKERDNILNKMVEMIQATIYGGIIVALTQGGLGGIGFWIVGLPSPFFWGTIMAFFSFVPVVGAYLVWIPASALLIAQGAFLKGLILFGWGVVIISLSDNVIRPIFISGRTQVPTLLLFLGILGGLQVFGFLGFIAGPLVITICLTLVNIYATAVRKKWIWSGSTAKKRG